MKERNKIIDILRGIATISVLLGHAIQRGLVNGYERNFIFKLIYSFHMPLFVILSGYTLNMYTEKYNFKFLIKKFRRLIIPTIIWSYIIFFVRNFKLVGIKPFIHFPESFLEYTKLLILHPDYVIWFLCIIFYGMVIICFLKNMCKESSVAFVSCGVMLTIVLHMLPDKISNYFAINSFKIYFPIFLLGYIGVDYKEMLLKYKNQALIVAIILYLVLFKIYNIMIGSVFVFYTISIAAITILYYISRKIEKSEILTKILSFFGKYSLQIYLLQCICLNIGFGSGVFRIITIYISATVISSILAYITTKNKFIRFILYGG